MASESLGVRSLSLYIENKNEKIIIDPGAALGPRRYSLPPSKVELKALDYSKKRILNFLEKSDIVIITHYHYDHYTPEADYSGKRVLLKHPKRNINLNQKRRASKFIKNLEFYEYADEKDINIGNTRIKISPPVPHGKEGTRLGFVIMCLIENKKRILYASDSQMLNELCVKWTIKQMPDIVVTSGPPTYLRHVKSTWELGVKNINKIIYETDANLILDHHIVRDKRYKEFFEEIDCEVLTCAKYLGMEDIPLEAYRGELHKMEKGKSVSIPFSIPKHLASY
ncbi:Predicted hydrolase of the metallo-beta-lactamase superfamily [Methanothermus fervidus DSM 2088]|uniref:UPF0282 protein Mfer_0956 n=1 Tax=Methanothermus fervidus (strain ATCC 43054 / DSM 2088 / JCM 10308 / V24 S) TaxID=523846 RepID=E3GVY7_METFV|nr:MBL fold metallo-hydrolase [Methanothermus fervidus]ADP77752.1 Predicted hydrolase of the metallo-beta-lactamase superfamily [Methanothermus fervidus DSM 2088]